MPNAERQDTGEEELSTAYGRMSERMKEQRVELKRKYKSRQLHTPRPVTVHFQVGLLNDFA